MNTAHSRSSLNSCEINKVANKIKYEKNMKLVKNSRKISKETGPMFQTPNDSHYVERIYKKQKWSFVSLEKNFQRGLKGSKIPKSQTRKSILPILAPDHYEALCKQRDMVLKYSHHNENVDKSLSVMLQKYNSKMIH